MKNIKKIVFTAVLAFLMTSQVNAAGSVSISASSNYVTTGSQVTFYIYVNNAAAWSLSGYGVGSTTGCSLGDNGVGDSGTGANVSKTIASVTCTTTSVGQVGFVVTGNISSANGSNIVKTNVNTSKSVTVQKPREKDTNNYLKSIGIKNYTLTPDFNKETLEYSVNVPSTVDKITLEAEKESNYASLTGTGEFEVNEGINTFEINVTSETGSERVYKVTVNVEDENPINVNLGNSSYTIMKNAKTLEKPTTYEPTTIKIKDFDIPAFRSDISNLTLIGVKDSKGSSHFVIYDEKNSTYELYNENKTPEQLLFIQKIEDEKDGFTKKNVTINSASYDAFVSNKDENIILVKAMNIKTGETHLYQYDSKEGTYIIYNESLITNIEEELKNQKRITQYYMYGLGGSIFLILLLLIIRPKRKKEPIMKETRQEEVKIEKLELEEKKEDKIETVQETVQKTKENKKSKKKHNKKKQIEEQEAKQEILKEKQEEIKVEQISPEKKPAKRTKEEALKQVSDAASIIEEYEKTIQLSSKELARKKKEIEAKEKESEETMYDIFEDDKKRKQRK